jgi:5-methylcytosine-specific restriction endonuclease McrA
LIEYRRLQTRLFKARHPERIADQKNGYRDRRNKRIALQADGTADRMIERLMRKSSCQYCGHKFKDRSEKRIDHRDPISRGGQHSAANLELCCASCNSRKSAMPFIEWVSLLQEPFRSKAIARAEKARGGPIHQQMLTMVFTAKT